MVLAWAVLLAVAQQNPAFLDGHLALKNPRKD